MIIVDQNILRGASRDIESKIQELIELNNSLDSILMRIGDSWDGSASEAYLNMMRNYANQAKEMIIVLKEFKKYVETTVTNFENTDKSCASRIRGAF